MKRVLDRVSSILSRETGLKVLYDPQPVRDAEPHLRLTFMGTEPMGIDADRIMFQLSLIGAGDGPAVFLPALIKGSLLIERLYDNCEGPRYRDFSIDGLGFRISFVEGLTPQGSFSQNEMAIVETNQWTYLWNEPRYMTISVPSEFWGKEKR